MTARERVIELLKSYPYACPSAVAGGISHRRDSVALRMPDLWYQGSYAELDRCLRELRAEQPDLYWHVAQRYIRADVLPMVVPVRRSRWGAKPILAPYIELVGGLAGPTGRTCRVVVRRWDHRVREDLVSEAVAWLVWEMYGGNSRRITVPRELLSEAA